MVHGGLAHFFVVYAAAVVLDFNINMVAAMVSTHGDVSGVALALLVSFFVALQAVGHRVAHQMNQRIGNLLDDVVVQLGLRAGQRELHFLVHGLGGVAHGA